MAKEPQVKAPRAARKDRQTQISSGPAPILGPPPTDPQVSAAGPGSSKGNGKKTQMLMGFPPIPPVVPQVKAPVAPPLPSHQETAIGPAPAPPTPTVRSVDATMPAPGSSPSPTDSTMPAPAPGSRPSPADATMPAPGSTPSKGDPFDVMFGKDFRAEAKSSPHDTLLAAEHEARDVGTRDTLVSTKSKTSPAVNPRDTVPSAAPNDATVAPTPTRDIADTQPSFHTDPGAEPSDRRPTTAVVKTRGRDSRVGTQMHGTEGLSAPAVDAPKIRLVPGKVIPGTRYLIRRWLGEGGMGVVYEVTHTDIERSSALKILRFDLSQQPQMAQVFRDEARAASRLGSPNIVEVYDFGELHDGRLYFAMELLKGDDLVPHDEQTCMEPERFIAIMRQACKGLAKAHEAGVVHRDVKPENIILSEIDDREDTVKIVDFGISAMLAAGERRAGIAGTPHYMAPEQILGDEFDGRLDIYALGCTAYELLVGVPPFDADEVEDILRMQMKKQPTPPSQVREGLSIVPQLEAVVMRCLAKRPQDRYENMADLEAALCEAQIEAGIVTAWDDLPVPVLPDEARYQRIVDRMPSPHAQPVARSWLWPIVAGTSTVAAVGLGALLMFGFQPSDAERDQVEQLTIEARDAASKASWVIPPPNLDQPTTTTALIKVTELEDLPGSGADMADERAGELRAEFATTLLTYGDKLWVQAPDIARQYYAWSALFEPSDYAMSRANIDMFTFENFRKRALAADFNEAEVLLAGTAVVAVVDDPEQKAAVEKSVDKKLASSESLPPFMRESIQRSRDSAGFSEASPARGSGAGRTTSRAKPSDAAAPPIEAPLILDDESEADGGPDDEPELSPEDKKAEAGRKVRRRQADIGLNAGGKVEFDPQRSDRLTKEADAKRKQGLRNQARVLYGKAIAANPKNGKAYLGMAEVHFGLGAYHKARKAAQSAVKYSPRNSAAWALLGNAWQKEHRAKEALAAYKEAQRLGAPRMAKRIADVESLLND